MGMDLLKSANQAMSPNRVRKIRSLPCAYGGRIRSPQEKKERQESEWKEFLVTLLSASKILLVMRKGT